MGSSEQIEQGRQKEDEHIEVSYTILKSVNLRNPSDNAKVRRIPISKRSRDGPWERTLLLTEQRTTTKYDI
jgi:hypothetical protein